MSDWHFFLVSDHLNSWLLRADRPPSCGMLGYKPATSTVHKIMLSRKFGEERSFSKKIYYLLCRILLPGWKVALEILKKRYVFSLVVSVWNNKSTWNKHHVTVSEFSRASRRVQTLGHSPIIFSVALCIVPIRGPGSLRISSQISLYPSCFSVISIPDNIFFNTF